jgi:hypothetical protein
MAFDAPTAAPKPFALSDKQLRQELMMSSAATWCATYGGARSGKTFGKCRAIATRSVMAYKSRHLIARFRTNAVKRTIGADTWPKMMGLCFPSVKWEYNKSEGLIYLPAEKSEVWLSGLDSPDRIDKILGSEFATILLNEASEIPWGTVEVLETRLAQNATITLGPRKGQMLRQKLYADLNPGSKRHWSHLLFKEKIHPADRGTLRNPDDYVCMQINPKDNPHLTERFLQSLQGLSKLQRRRFWDGEFNGEVDGSLWGDAMFRRCSRANMPQLVRIVIAVDPSGARHAKDVTADEIGIVVAGLGSDGVVYVLGDFSLRAGPAVWTELVCALYEQRLADAVIGETNYGGPLVEALVHSRNSTVRYKSVVASSGKHIRAEPVAGLYERGQVRHVGDSSDYEHLEDQLMQFTAAGYIGPGSPDRADALVWAITELKGLGIKQAAAATGGDAFASASRSR